MESERSKREVFSATGSETTQGNFDKAQRILEAGTQWDDRLRGLASEVNQLDRERTGVKPISFTEALQAISGYARVFEKMSHEPVGSRQDLESSMEIDNIAGDALDPGVEGIDTALAYIEGTLQSTANIADKLLRSTVTSNEDKAKFLNDWREKRAIRDALYQEKQKRAEQPVKPSGMTEEEIERSRKRLEELMSKKEANAPAPPEEVTQTPESERRSENPQDTKIKFGTVLQSFVRQFGDGTVTELFRAFVRNDPTSQQYDAAATKLYHP